MKAGDVVSLSGRDFEKYLRQVTGAGTFQLRGVRPSLQASDYADGYIYFRHGKSP